ncbi:MAG: DUF2608 domain-containing protein [Puniceicoccales bacterium]|jgi:hypothetical protein|nr:DUF2608 domain-containing protein [Puniceicoccales bacterium]
MKNHTSKLIVGVLMGALTFGVANMDALIQLNPDGVNAKLNECILSGEINENTLIVFDVDGTIIQPESDQNPNGPVPISENLPKVIKKAQTRGATVIALTSVSDWFDNQFGVVNGNLTVTSAIPKISPKGLVQAEAAGLRIEGLKHIGINLNNPSFQNLPKIFPCIAEEYRGGHLPEPIFKRDNFVFSFSDKEGNEWEHFAVPVGRTTDPVHLIRNQKANSRMEVLSAPIFSEGVLFTNHFSTRGSTNNAKGWCLIYFVNFYEQILGRKLTNIIFVDDSYTNVQDVEGAIHYVLGKEYLAIQICPNLKK